MMLISAMRRHFVICIKRFGEFFGILFLKTKLLVWWPPWSTPPIDGARWEILTQSSSLFLYCKTHWGASTWCDNKMQEPLLCATYFSGNLCKIFTSPFPFATRWELDGQITSREADQASAQAVSQPPNCCVEWASQRAMIEHLNCKHTWPATHESVVWDISIVDHPQHHWRCRGHE